MIQESGTPTPSPIVNIDQFVLIMFHQSLSTAGLLLNRKRLIAHRIEIVSIRIDVTTEKKVAAPLPSAEFLETMTQPLASAKSAMDQMKNHTNMIAEMT
jgi:hypothetical protein